METVWIVHPDLPDQPVQVPKTALPFHRLSGWMTLEEAGLSTPKSAQEVADAAMAAQIEASAAPSPEEKKKTGTGRKPTSEESG